jgi:hypothetical protein
VWYLVLCWKYSAVKGKNTKEVLKSLGILTRGSPRQELESRIRRSIGVLKRQNKIKEYKAKM